MCCMLVLECFSCRDRSRWSSVVVGSCYVYVFCYVYVCMFMCCVCCFVVHVLTYIYMYMCCVVLFYKTEPRMTIYIM